MSIPKSLVETILKTALSPETLGGVAGLFAAAGHPLDLGPMTPDAAKHFGDVDKRIDAQIAAHQDERSELDRAKARSTQVGALGVHVHENDGDDRGYRRPVPDPDPTPRPSRR
jgi:hypothetical protein